MTRTSHPSSRLWHSRSCASQPRVILDSVAHWWVLAGHPRYTSARKGRPWVAKVTERSSSHQTLAGTMMCPNCPGTFHARQRHKDLGSSPRPTYEHGSGAYTSAPPIPKRVSTRRDNRTISEHAQALCVYRQDRSPTRCRTPCFGQRWKRTPGRARVD